MADVFCLPYNLFQFLFLFYEIVGSVCSLVCVTLRQTHEPLSGILLCVYLTSSVSVAASVSNAVVSEVLFAAVLLVSVLLVADTAEDSSVGV